MSRRPGESASPPSRDDLRGRHVVVTGGTGGLGYWASEQLAARGASVVIAARSAEKGDAALASIARHVPGADVRFVRLDLADLASVESAAAEFAALPPLDALIANAGVLASHGRLLTADGFESMIGTNLLGHAAVIGRLLPRMLETGAPRIVSLGSISHEFFRLDLDDLQSERGRFREFRTYGRSKLAVMTFAFELDRRLRAAGADVASLVAHPGFAVDELTPQRDILPAPKTATALVRAGFRLGAQGKDVGALPLVAAAVDARAAGGQYWGPAGWRQLKGRPAVVAAKPYARDRAVAERLWAATEELTGIRYPV